jgi:hypothetical protein
MRALRYGPVPGAAICEPDGGYGPPADTAGRFAAVHKTRFDGSKNLTTETPPAAVLKLRSVEGGEWTQGRLCTVEVEKLQRSPSSEHRTKFVYLLTSRQQHSRRRRREHLVCAHQLLAQRCPLEAGPALSTRSRSSVRYPQQALPPVQSTLAEAGPRARAMQSTSRSRPFRSPRPHPKQALPEPVQSTPPEAGPARPHPKKGSPAILHAPRRYPSGKSSRSSSRVRSFSVQVSKTVGSLRFAAR